MDSKILAVTGNTGKTLFSFYLAQLLSATKRIALLCTDGFCPVYATLFPQAKKEPGHVKSLGKLLSLPVISHSDIFEHAYIAGDNLFIFSYDENETSYSYPEITDVNLQTLFGVLEHIADVIIVDTTTYYNSIDRFVLSLPEVQSVQITTADTKGFYYRQFQNGPVTRALYLPVSGYCSLQDVAQSFSKSQKAWELPNSKNLGAAYGGTNITDIVPSGKYRKILLDMAGELF